VKRCGAKCRRDGDVLGSWARATQQEAMRICVHPRCTCNIARNEKKQYARCGKKNSKNQKFDTRLKPRHAPLE
jgi:hypothetical protein